MEGEKRAGRVRGREEGREGWREHETKEGRDCMKEGRKS